MRASAPLGSLLQEVLDLDESTSLEDLEGACTRFLRLVAAQGLELVDAPEHPSYAFFQIKALGLPSRPINKNLFCLDPDVFSASCEAMRTCFSHLSAGIRGSSNLTKEGVAPELVDQVIYTMQQSIGCILDSHENSNTARKKAGQAFERLVGLTIDATGLRHSPRRVTPTIPGHPALRMPYSLRMVVSSGQREREGATALHDGDVVAWVKTVSKERFDKVFLEKHMLTKLLERQICGIAILLHDIQRATKKGNQLSLNSTLKTNHFIGYSLALVELDGLYYIDPPSAALENAEISKRCQPYHRLLTDDIWKMVSPTGEPS